MLVDKRGAQICAAVAISFLVNIAGQAVYGEVSQTKAAKTAEQDTSGISPEKKAAVKELLAVTEVTKVADRMYDMLLEEGQKNFTDSLMKSIQSDNRYTDEQKKDLLEKTTKSSERMFARYRELLPKSLNMGQVMEDVSCKVYDKYFSVSELKDITAFYKTPAGQKALAVLPQVMQESATMTSQIITPKVHSVVIQVVNEERQLIEKAAGEEALRQAEKKAASKKK